MSEPLRETARAKLIEHRVGLITTEALVAWADEEILRSDQPPDFLMAISLQQSLQFEPRLDLTHERVVDADCGPLARRILADYEAGIIDLPAIEGLALAATRLLLDHENSWVDFTVIADDIDLANCKAADWQQVRQKTLELLRRMAGRGVGA